MFDVNPVVRHMLLCEDVRPRPGNAQKIDVFGLFHAIRSTADEGGPARLPLCTVCLFLTEVHRRGMLQITMRSADTNDAIFGSADIPIAAASNPLKVVAIAFRLGPIEFPKPGLYIVGVCYDGTEIGQEPLLLRN